MWDWVTDMTPPTTWAPAEDAKTRDNPVTSVQTFFDSIVLLLGIIILFENL